MEGGYLKVFNIIWLDIVLSTSFVGAFRATFKIKITLDYRPKIRNNAWYYKRILGDLARYRLKYIIFEPLEHLLGSKSHLIIGQKNRNCAWYYRGILGLMAVFLLYIIKFTLDWLFFFGFFFSFSPRKRIFYSKSSKKLKVQKWCQNGSIYLHYLRSCEQFLVFLNSKIRFTSINLVDTLEIY